MDFFRIVNEQVAVVEAVSNGEMLLRTGETVLRTMREFQVLVYAQAQLLTVV